MTGVPVMAIRVAEAWLLPDGRLVREAAANPDGRVPLDRPAPKAVERVAVPKDWLEAPPATASRLPGRRLCQFRQRFPSRRRQLLERLNPAGPVSGGPSRQRVRRRPHHGAGRRPGTRPHR